LDTSGWQQLNRLDFGSNRGVECGSALLQRAHTFRITMMTLMRGMLPWSPFQIGLKFDKYVKAAALPQVPHQFGHVKRDDLPVTGSWGMLGNDRKGDCTVAGIAHGQEVWDWATKRTIPRFTDQNIIDQYLSLTGGNDGGLDPIQVAGYWRNSGLQDADGNIYKIEAYSGITSTSSAVLAAYLFGFSGIGLYMPNSAEAQFEKGHVWDDTSGRANVFNGHYVPLVGRNSAGHLMVVTWGQIHAMTQDWLDKYFMGGVGYISRDYFLSSGLSPEGFAFDTLVADLKAISIT
jgi:hypothetical protein